MMFTVFILQFHKNSFDGSFRCYWMFFSFALPLLIIMLFYVTSLIRTSCVFIHSDLYSFIRSFIHSDSPGYPTQRHSHPNSCNKEQFSDACKNSQLGSTCLRGKLAGSFSVAFAWFRLTQAALCHLFARCYCKCPMILSITLSVVYLFFYFYQGRHELSGLWTTSGIEASCQDLMF